MNIAINALLVTKKSGGVTTFLTHLVDSLSSIESDNTYYLMVRPDNEDIFSNRPNVVKIQFPRIAKYKLLRVILEQVLIPRRVREYKIDVLLSTGSVATFFSGCRQVFVVQAALTLRNVRRMCSNEAQVPFLKSVYYTVGMPLSIRVADRIIAVSHDLKMHIMKEFGVPEEKVAVIHEGVDIGLAQKSGDEAKAYDKPYILFIGTLFKYKNADKLLAAFARLKRNSAIPHRLVIVGRPVGNALSELEELARREGVFGDVVLAGAVEHKDISGIYREADVFVFPSGVESFGLPVLEAMACDTPVVASNRMSVPEVAGDAALIVDPDDIDEMADAIYRVISDGELRERLVSRGHERVKSLTWERAAAETLRILDEAVNG